MHKLLATLQYWARGVRLYIAAGILLVTVEVLWWGRAVFGDTELAVTRIQEVYGWLSVGLLVTALLIGPVTKAFTRLPGKPLLWDARRLIGVGAAWFALLHTVIVYLAQFASANPFALPELYRQSLLLGVIALVALLLLAGTSFNAIMKAWGVWWFRLHRLIYVAVLAALMHAFMIGAHAPSKLSLILLGAVSAIWIGLNLYFLFRDPKAPWWRILALALGTLMLLAVLNYGLTRNLGYNTLVNDHSEHE
jgi:sulfoxide reductase heme-binding subunit YedZ